MKKVDVFEKTKDITDDWKNLAIAEVNDHEVRVSVISREFHWHVHQKSDELFYIIEGRLFVDFEDRTVELAPGQMITVPKGVRHRTRSEERTLLLCFESKGNSAMGD
jgi:mannose-6-phosphate isomerase-like protein (cupin superfamily)